MEKESKQALGRLLSVHGIAPAYLQRAVFIVVLSFLFFLIMMFVYYARQSLVYFLLASAFLLLYLITMFSWVMQRRNIVSVYENGVSYRGRSASWSEIHRVDDKGTLHITNGKPMVLPQTLHESERIMNLIKRNLRKTAASA